MKITLLLPGMGGKGLGRGGNKISLTSTFHWPFSRDVQLIAIISYANDLSSAFSLICFLFISVVFFRFLSFMVLILPQNSAGLSLRSLMSSLPLHNHSRWTMPAHSQYSHSHHSFMQCLTVHRRYFFLFFFSSFCFSNVGLICKQAMMCPLVVSSFHCLLFF